VQGGFIKLCFMVQTAQMQPERQGFAGFAVLIAALSGSLFAG